MLDVLIPVFAPPLLLSIFKVFGDRRLVLGHCFGVEVSLSVPNYINCFGFVDKSKEIVRVNADAICRLYSLVRVGAFLYLVYHASSWGAVYMVKWDRKASDIENMERTLVCGVVKSVIQVQGGKWPVLEVSVINDLGQERKARILKVVLSEAEFRVGRKVIEGGDFCFGYGYADGGRMVYKFQVEGMNVLDERGLVKRYLQFPEYPISGLVSIALFFLFIFGLREVADE